MTESEVLAAITAQEAFKGYELFAYRKLRLDEWQPETPSPLDLIAARVQI
jgi:hypothetical protein